jgi:hypothetical protein
MWNISNTLLNYKRWTSEIKPRITMTKIIIQQGKDSLQQQNGLKLKEETVELLHLEYSFVWC